jgi:hypothetical protein
MSFAALQARVNSAAMAKLSDVATINTVAVNVKFVESYADPLGFSGSSPSLLAISTEMTGLAQGSAVFFGGVNYTVTAIKPDGNGMTRLMLQEV